MKVLSKGRLKLEVNWREQCGNWKPPNEDIVEGVIENDGNWKPLYAELDGDYLRNLI
jgi:hypothetical protein